MVVQLQSPGTGGHDPPAEENSSIEERMGRILKTPSDKVTLLAPAKVQDSLCLACVHTHTRPALSPSWLGLAQRAFGGFLEPAPCTRRTLSFENKQMISYISFKDLFYQLSCLWAGSSLHWQPRPLIPVHVCLETQTRESAAWPRKSLQAHKLLCTNHCPQRETAPGLPPHCTGSEWLHRGASADSESPLASLRRRRSFWQNATTASDPRDATGTPSLPGSLWAGTGVHSQTRKEFKERTHPHHPSHVRDTITPFREETSVLKRKRTWKPLKSYPYIWLLSPKPF